MATKIYELRRRARIRLLENYTLTTPGAPNVSPQGTPGATTVAYAISALNETGESIASQVKTIATSAATLTGTNYNQITWTAVRGATSYNVWRTDAPTSPATTGLIGNVTAVSFDDTGVAGDGTEPPDVNTSGLESPFWDDDDLTRLIIDGAKDLWKAIIELGRNHFMVIDITTMSFETGDDELTGVPVNLHRVLRIEPRDITETGTNRAMTFRPKPYQSEAFERKRAIGTQSPSFGQSEFFYDIINPGSPVDAPTIVVAPRTNSQILLRVSYVKTLDALTEESDNPIPGESDNALIAWCVAYARANERDDRMPDPAWLSIYATDKQGLLTTLSPRQAQESEVVEDIFGASWGTLD